MKLTETYKAYNVFRRANGSITTLLVMEDVLADSDGPEDFVVRPGDCEITFAGDVEIEAPMSGVTLPEYMEG